MNHHEELTIMAEHIRQRDFSHLQQLKIRINPRLKRTLGRLVIPIGDDEPYIEIASKCCKGGEEVQLEDIIKHEYLHYEMHQEGCVGHCRKFLERARDLKLC